jgi:hypothetical protein
MCGSNCLSQRYVTHATFRKLAVLLSDGDWLLFWRNSFRFSSFYDSERDAVLGEVSKQLSQPTGNCGVFLGWGKKSESETSRHVMGFRSSLSVSTGVSPTGKEAGT